MFVDFGEIDVIQVNSQRVEEDVVKLVFGEVSTRFAHSLTTATKPLPIERALETDLLSI